MRDIHRPSPSSKSVDFPAKNAEFRASENVDGSDEDFSESNPKPSQHPTAPRL
jgi:hypothetical protein